MSPITGERQQYQINRASNQMALRTVRQRMEDGDSFSQAMPYSSRDFAELFGGRLVEDREIAKIAIHTLDITPAIRNAALGEGFPLFEKRGLGRQSPVLRPENFSPAAQQHYGALRRMIEASVLMIAGPEAAVGFQQRDRLVGEVAEMPAPGYAQGLDRKLPRAMYHPGIMLIEIALAGPDPLSSSYHELWHHVEIRLLNDRELDLLKAETPRLRPILESVYGLTKEQAAGMAGYEVRAYAFQTFDHGKGAAFALSPGVRGIFERIARVIRRLRNALRGLGFRTAEDIFGAAYRGEFADRPVQEPTDLDALARGLDPVITTEAFKKWFGNSRVVDAQGNPLAVYHGTRAAFEAFDPTKRGTATGAPSAEVGFFFTDRVKTAEYYAGLQGRAGKAVANQRSACASSTYAWLLIFAVWENWTRRLNGKNARRMWVTNPRYCRHIFRFGTRSCTTSRAKCIAARPTAI